MIIQREREQIRTRIAELEAITNRTAEQEAELRSLKEKLTKLEQQETKKTNWTPWIIGGGIILVLVIGIVAYLLSKNKPKKDNF